MAPRIGYNRLRTDTSKAVANSVRLASVDSHSLTRDANSSLLTSVSSLDAPGERDDTVSAKSNAAMSCIFAGEVVLTLHLWAYKAAESIGANTARIGDGILDATG